jgi:hypothetical protein
MERVKPETVVKILAAQDVHISLAEAGLIVEFLSKLVDIALTKTMQHES